MTRSMLVLTVGILTLASSSHAQQDTARLVPGERVRVKLEKGGHVVGTFLSADATTMRVLTAPPDTASVDRAAVAAVEVSVGTKSRAPSGALIGATVGALAAASIAYLAEGSPGSQDLTLVVGAAVGGLFLGGGVGALIGSGKRTDRWEPVAWPVMTIPPGGPVGLGLALGLHLSF